MLQTGRLASVFDVIICMTFDSVDSDLLLLLQHHIWHIISSIFTPIKNRDIYILSKT